MRKYRYGDPTKGGFFRKYGNFLYFFAAWNLLGLVAWKSMTLNRSGDSEWEKKSSGEKYLALIGYGKENKDVTHVKMHGLQRVQADTESEKND